MTDRPAAWLPDPSKRGFDLRYWNGTDWTEHVTKGGEQTTDPEGAKAAKWLDESTAPKAAAAPPPSAEPSMSRRDRKAAEKEEADAAAQAARGAKLESGGLTAKGVGGQITVEGDWITISRKGLMAKSTHGLTGDKRIPVSSLTAVQFKKPGIANGYLQLVLIGSQESKRGVMDAAKDENSVMFTSRQQADFEAIRDHLEQRITQRMTMSSSPTIVQAAAPTLASQLKELAELRDQGILTDEEFQAQKTKLLEG